MPGQIRGVDPVSRQAADLDGPIQVIATCAVNQNDSRLFPYRLRCPFGTFEGMIVNIVGKRHGLSSRLR